MWGTDGRIEQPPLSLTHLLTRVARACPAWPGCGGACADVDSPAEGPLAFCSVPGCVGILLFMKRLNPNCLKRLRKATMSLSLRFGTISPNQVNLQHWKCRAPSHKLQSRALRPAGTSLHWPNPHAPPAHPPKRPSLASAATGKDEALNWVTHAAANPQTWELIAEAPGTTGAGVMTPKPSCTGRVWGYFASCL